MGFFYDFTDNKTINKPHLAIYIVHRHISTYVYIPGLCIERGLSWKWLWGIPLLVWCPALCQTIPSRSLSLQQVFCYVGLHVLVP